VKEQNPGVDLLIHYDWEAAAAQVAEKFGHEEGNSFGIDQFFPLLPLAGDAKMPDAAANQSSSTLTPASGTVSATVNEAETVPPTASRTDESSGSAADASIALSTSSDTVSEPLAGRDSTSTTFSVKLMWTIAAGIVIAAIVLAGATMLVLRPR
jgi:hypothetical protein